MAHSTSPSLYGSPQEAIQAPTEEFLYLTCCTRGPASARRTSWR